MIGTSARGDPGQLPRLRLADEPPHRRVARAGPRYDLVDRARGRVLVGSHAQQPRAVAKPEALPLVVAHLDDELRADGQLLELASSPRDSAPRSGGREHRRRAVRAGRRSRPDGRVRRRPSPRSADPPPRRAARAEVWRGRPPAAIRGADDDAVGGAVALDLDDAVARAGEVREPEPLGDHTVEAGDLERLQPARRLLSVAARDRDPERQPLEAGAPLLDRQLPDLLARPRAGRRTRRSARGSPRRACARGSPPDAGASASRRSRAAVALDHDLAVEGRPRRETPLRAGAAPGSSAGAAGRCGSRATARPPRFSSTPRNPSHFGSYCQPSPGGSSGRAAPPSAGTEDRAACRSRERGYQRPAQSL